MVIVQQIPTLALYTLSSVSGRVVETVGNSSGDYQTFLVFQIVPILTRLTLTETGVSKTVENFVSLTHFHAQLSQSVQVVVLLTD